MVRTVKRAPRTTCDPSTGDLDAPPSIQKALSGAAGRPGDSHARMQARIKAMSAR
jgi:hypothetical protein